MIKIIGLTTTLLLTIIPVTTFAKDTLRLKNGDILSGEIIKFSLAGVSIQAPYGTLDISVDHIGGIESPRYQFTDLMVSDATDMDPVLIATLDPSLPYDNQLTPLPTYSQQEARVESPAPAAITKDESEDIATLWGALWSGNINAGAELETGNSDSNSLSLDGESRMNWDDIHRWTLGATYDREEENDLKVEDKHELYTAYDYFFADKWFWNNAASYEVDKIESLDSRIEATTGLGHQFYDEDDLSLEATLGPGYQREEYTNQDAEDSMTANWTLDYEQKFYDDVVRLFHNHDWVAPTDEMSSWLFQSASGVKVPLRAGIIAMGEVDFDYNNDPAIGEGEDDTTYRLKLGYEWP